MEPVDEVIRKNLERFRAEAGLSQAQVADLSGVPMTNLSRYERGENTIPAGILPALASVFGRTPGDFYLEDPGPPPPDSELDVFFLRTRPGREVDEKVLAEVRAALRRGNDLIRKQKGKR